LICLEDSARIVATSAGPELIWALSIDISCAPYSAAVAWYWTEVHRNIKPINKRYVKEIQVVELVQGIFSQCVWGLPEGLALQEPIAITCLTRPSPGPIEIALGPSPNTGLCCSGIRGDGPWLAWVESLATTGNSRGPDSISALVSDFESSCVA
jgi:hypothetical protein